MADGKWKIWETRRINHEKDERHEKLRYRCAHMKRAIKKDAQGRLQYGGGLIKERTDWMAQHPLGAVHWEVWGSAADGRPLIGEDVPANELQGLMVSNGLLFLW